MPKWTTYRNGFNYLTGSQDGITVDPEKWLQYNIELMQGDLWDGGVKLDMESLHTEIQVGEWSSRVFFRVDGRPRVKGVD